jgi:hypothetical protein
MAAVAVSVSVLGALHASVVVRRRVGFLGSDRIAEVAGHRAALAVVTAFHDPASERLDRRGGRVILDSRSLRDRVRLDRQHALLTTERALHDRFLGGVVEAAYMQNRRHATASVSAAAIVPAPVVVLFARGHVQVVFAKRWTAASKS